MSTPTTPPAPKRRGPLPWILGGVAVVLLLCAGFVLLGALVDNETDTASPTGAAPARTTVAAAKTPTSADFKLSAKITEQTCYGEIGCSVTWLPVAVYSGPAIPAGQTWLVSYEVSGLESGTKIGRIVVGRTGPAKQNEKHGRTADEDSKITLKVTGVEAA